MDDDEVLTLVAMSYDAIEILDTLQMDESDLVEALRKQILDNVDEFKEIDRFRAGE